MSEDDIKVHRKEYHEVISTFKYSFPKEDVIKKFGTLEQFEKEMKEFTEKFLDFESETGHYDREDDWWTDRKGGYEVEYELIKND